MQQVPFQHYPQQPTPPIQPRLKKIFLYPSGLLALVSLFCFIYVVLTWMGDQNNGISLLADAESIIRLAIIGFLCFFLSYLLAITALFSSN